MVTTICGYLMMRRLFTVSETALADVRTRAFRHIHDLSMLHQQSERRGSLVSRVTSDVDQITQFLQWGGVILLVNLGQLVVTTAVMLRYSWQLTLVVLAAFVPAVLRRSGCSSAGSAGAYGDGARSGSGTLLGAIARERGGRAGDPGVRGRRPHRAAAGRRRSTAQRLAQQRAIRISIVRQLGRRAGGRGGAGRRWWWSACCSGVGRRRCRSAS